MIKKAHRMCFCMAILLPVTLNAAEPQPFLGLQIQGVSPSIAQALGHQSNDGVLIRDIAFPGPASISDLRRGDLLISLDGKKVKSTDEVVEQVKHFEINQIVSAQVLRRGRVEDIELMIGTLPALWNVTKNSFLTIHQLGISFASLTPQVQKKFDIGWRTRGVVVSVVDKSKSAGVDLAVGDVIVQVNQNPVITANDVIKEIKKAQADAKELVLLLVEGKDGLRFVLLPIPQLEQEASEIELAPLPNLAPN